MSHFQVFRHAPVYASGGHRPVGWSHWPYYVAPISAEALRLLRVLPQYWPVLCSGHSPDVLNEECNP